MQSSSKIFQTVIIITLTTLVLYILATVTTSAHPISARPFFGEGCVYGVNPIIYMPLIFTENKFTVITPFIESTKDCIVNSGTIVTVVKQIQNPFITIFVCIYWILLIVIISIVIIKIVQRLKSKIQLKALNTN